SPRWPRPVVRDLAGQPWAEIVAGETPERSTGIEPLDGCNSSPSKRFTAVPTGHEYCSLETVLGTGATRCALPSWPSCPSSCRYGYPCDAPPDAAAEQVRPPTAPALRRVRGGADRGG